MANIFSTFCHVTEYKEEAYRNLHRLVATSDQLGLWAPSWTLMNHYYSRGICRVSPNVLLDLLEKHEGIHVLGRTEWLLDSKSRPKAKGMEWAAWSKADDRLLSIWKNEQCVPEPQRAVKVAPKERGWEVAKEFLDKHPQIGRDIQSWIKKNRAPRGSLEKIDRMGLTGRKATELVVRDAANHAHAAQFYGTEKMWLSYRDGRFLQLMNQCAPKDIKPLRSTDEAQCLGNFRLVVEQILDDLDEAGLLPLRHEQDVGTLLKRVAARFASGKERCFEDTFKGFLKSEGRKSLLEWMRTYSEVLQHVPAEYLNETVRKLLTAEIRHGSECGGVLEAFDLTGSSLRKVQALGEFLTAILAFLHDPHGALGIAEIVFRMVPGVCHELYRIGLLPGEGRGPQFVFPYAFGRAGRYPTTRMRDAAANAIEFKQGSRKRS